MAEGLLLAETVEWVRETWDWTGLLLVQFLGSHGSSEGYMNINTETNKQTNKHVHSRPGEAPIPQKHIHHHLPYLLLLAKCGGVPEKDTT